jgi:hypothetical protein
LLELLNILVWAKLLEQLLLLAILLVLLDDILDDELLLRVGPIIILDTE